MTFMEFVHAANEILRVPVLIALLWTVFDQHRRIKRLEQRLKD